MNELEKLDMDAKGELAKVEDEVLNPSNHLHTPIVESTVIAAHAVEGVAAIGATVKADVEGLVGKIGLPGHGV